MATKTKKNLKVRKAIFPVGGLGTRFLPATKAMPKEMLPILDKPLIQYAFEEARNAGIEQFIFVTGRNKHIISDHFDHAYELEKVLSENDKKHLLELARGWLPEAGSIAYTRQQQPLGLGHAVYCARNFVGNEPFAVLLADEIFISEKKSLLQEMAELYEETGGNIIGVADVDMEEVSRYGIITPEKDDGKVIKITAMVEKPSPENAPSNISIVGRYILQPEIFNHLAEGKKGKGGEVQLTDSMAAMLKDSVFHGVRFKGERYDCGHRRGWLKANIAFAIRDKAMHSDIVEMLKGFVTKG